ncbi:hypothetical protein CLOP_g17207 [Closterium sp. NIES-67]|nr:hypothetical protein CLOP_g17207 [Closterium sp. NIES-67]
MPHHKAQAMELMEWSDHAAREGEWPLAWLSRLEDWEFARQLLDAKNPFATDNVNSSRRRDVRERVVANECFTLRDHGCEPLGGVWSRDGFII